MSQSCLALITVAKYPGSGDTKTRLSPPLTPSQAADLYACFLRDTLDQMRQVPGVRRVIAYTPEYAGSYFTELGPDFECIPQAGVSLGPRLDNALTHYLQQGCAAAVIMNSDSPTLPPAYLVQAFEVLAEDTDVVLGPTQDGGYYLIGLKKPAPRLLREARISTQYAAADTIRLAAEDSLCMRLLPEWYDVDDGLALLHLKAELINASIQTAPHTRSFLELIPLMTPG